MEVVTAIERVLPRHQTWRRVIRVCAVTIPTVLWAWVWWPGALVFVALSALVLWA